MIFMTPHNMNEVVLGDFHVPLLGLLMVYWPYFGKLECQPSSNYLQQKCQHLKTPIHLLRTSVGFLTDSSSKPTADR